LIAIELDDTCHITVYNLAQSFFNQNKYDLAENYFLIAIK